jgi:hypothetical protein
MTAELERIILQFKMPYPSILKHLERYITFYNSFLSSFQEGALYMEITEQGIIFFYRDMTIVQKIIHPFKFDENKISQTSKNFLKGSMLTPLFPPSLMPLNGLIIEIQVVRGDPRQILPLSQTYIKSVSSDIDITQIDDRTLKVFLPTYSVVMLYIRNLVIKYVEGRVPVDSIPGLKK